MPMASWPWPVATARVVPDPTNGSRTRAGLQLLCPQSVQPRSVTNALARTIPDACAVVPPRADRHGLAGQAGSLPSQTYSLLVKRLLGSPHVLHTLGGAIAFMSGSTSAGG